MRILFLSPVGQIGGAERVLLTAMRAIRSTRPGTEMHLLCALEGPLCNAAREAGAHVRVLAMPKRLAELGDSGLRGAGERSKFVGLSRGLLAGMSSMRYLAQLRAHVRAIDPDIVHSNGIKTHLLTPLLPRTRAAIVWHIHDFIGSRPLVSGILKRCTRRVACAVAISKAVQRDAQAILGDLPVSVILNAVDTSHFSPSVGEQRADLDALSDLPPLANCTRIGLVATYARWKGQDLFLLAAARMLKENPSANVRFYIVGGPIYRTQGSQFSKQELKSLARELGIERSVGFIDMQADPLAMYRALDAVVHASTHPEPFGLTIAEAMACARPVIVSAAGGAVELISSGHDAVGVVPGDAPALAAAMTRLVQSPAQRHSLASAARVSALHRFSPARFAAELITVYARYAGRPMPQKLSERSNLVTS